MARAARGAPLDPGRGGGSPDEAQLPFAGDSADEAFARADPYVTNGLVAKWRVRKWITVVGEGAAQPIA